MKNSSFIQNEVFKINLEYVRLQNKTKELFFKCLDEGRDIEYFKAKLEELWGKIDHSYYDDKLVEYEQLIHEYYDIEYKDPIVPKFNYMTLIPIGVVLAQELRFKDDKSREYSISVNSYAYKNDKQDYLKKKVQKYTSQIVPYYNRTTGELMRYVDLSTYEAMIFNTNLTRDGWNTTLNDADYIGANLFYIPYHNFSCPECAAMQNKILTRDDVQRLIGHVEEEIEGDILHPNCKCVLTIYENGTKIRKTPYSDSELDEFYHTRQKINTLTLNKERILSDIKIQKSLGNQDEVDKLNQKRNAINSQIRELKGSLPTEELQKQVVAINR